jgi:2,3-dihydroxy-p-cumate/2,3-dihydroxybenzoate 3,4-dioxygenase
MESRRELEDLFELLSKRRLPVAEIDKSESDGFHHGRSFRLAEPITGITFEFCDAVRERDAPYRPTVANIERVGHVVVKTPHLDDATRFFSEVMNFCVSDVIDGMIAFLRCHPNPLHHSFAIGAGSPGLHHVNFMVRDIDDIGRAFWRLQRGDVPIVHGPGRHPPSGSVFLYFLDPDGMTLEYSFGMEEFPEQGARKPRLLEPIDASFELWGAVRDKRKGTVGDIERF